MHRVNVQHDNVHKSRIKNVVRTYLTLGSETLSVLSNSLLAYWYGEKGTETPPMFHHLCFPIIKWVN